MSHAELLDWIQAGDEWSALQVFRGDARLCAETGDPSALMMALYRHMGVLARAIAARRPSMTVFEAAASNTIPVLERILAEDDCAAKRYAGDGFTALHLSCYFGHPHAAALLLRDGADPRARARNATCLCPLHSAAVRGSVMISLMLLHAGADPNAVQQGGYTPLHAAALRGFASLAELLLDWGADIRARSEDGQSASAIAHRAGHYSLGDWLAARGG